MSEAPLPTDKLPQCWSDDVRMNALFAPFRCKSLNPESWDGKMKFWSEIIKLWCSYKRDAFVSVAKVKSTFRRNGRTPACLDLVVEDMVNTGALVPKDKYSPLTTPDATGWLQWGTGKALSSGGIALHFITSFLPSPFKTRESEDGFPIASISPETVYLMEGVLKDISQELLQAYPKTEARIGTLEELRAATVFAASGSEIDCDMFAAVLGYMLTNKMATRKGELFKIAVPGTPVQPISEQDVTLHQLRTAETTLEEKAARLYEKAEEERMAAVASLRAGNKSAARSSLRRKNWLTQQYEDTEKLLDNVRQLAYRIQQTDSDAKVLDTYKNTVNAMKKTQVEQGLEVDNVHDLMEDLNEIIESAGEVQKTLSAPVSSTLDDSELERELEELLAEPSEQAPGGSGGGGGDRSLQDLDGLLDGLVLESGSPDAGKKTEGVEKIVECV